MTSDWLRGLVEGFAMALPAFLVLDRLAIPHLERLLVRDRGS